MNPYVLGGGAVVIAIMGFLLKGAYERNGELEAKLETQANETVEAADANVTCNATVTELEGRIMTMIEERRVDSERREQVLVEREQEVLQLRARTDQLEENRQDEIDTNPDCADLTSLSLDMFCPATAHELRQRSIGASSNGDPDG